MDFMKFHEIYAYYLVGQWLGAMLTTWSNSEKLTTWRAYYLVKRVEV